MQLVDADHNLVASCRFMCGSAVSSGLFSPHFPAADRTGVQDAAWRAACYWHTGPGPSVPAVATVNYAHAAIAAAAAACCRRVLPPRIAIRRTPRGEWPTECRGALCTAGAPRGRCLQPSVHTRGAPDSGRAASPGAVRERCAQWLAVAPSAGFAEEEREWGIMGKPNGDGCGCGGGSFGR